MKRGHSGLVAKALVALLAGTAALSAAGCSKASANAKADFSFKLVDGGEAVAITGYTGSGGDVVIPGQIDGIPVKAIAESAFRDNDSITSVVIPEGVVAIDWEAFYMARNLRSVTLPSTLELIGTGAFNRTAVKSVTIPESVRYMDFNAFTECDQLVSVTIPDGWTPAAHYGSIHEVRPFTRYFDGEGIRSDGALMESLRARSTREFARDEEKVRKAFARKYGLTQV